MLTQLDTENADFNLTSQQTVLTDTPSTTQNRLCQGVIHLGDGSKDLDGTGGAFECVIVIGSQTVQPSPQYIVFGTEVRSAIVTNQFVVPANTAVYLKILSPNAADTDVDVVAELYAVDDVNVKAINNNNDAAVALALSADSIIPATVDTTGGFTPTTTQLEADDITEATADHYNGRIIIFTSGALLGQATDITDYVLSGANGKFTYTTLTEAPANNDTFIII